MPSQTNEQALEASIEKRLTGTSLEELQANKLPGAVYERAPLYRSGNGYFIGATEDFNPRFAANSTKAWRLTTARCRQLSYNGFPPLNFGLFSFFVANFCSAR